MQRNQMDLNLKPESVKDFAMSAYTSLMTMFKTENIKMAYDIPDEIPAIHVDGTLIGRVFKNIVGNALKYTPTNGEIRVTAQVADDNPKFVTVMISDTGNGIPKGMQDQIFSQYVTATEEQEQHRGTRGIGLGLTFCKLAVESHGGHIYANNNGPLSGATFYFTLPVV